MILVQNPLVIACRGSTLEHCEIVQSLYEDIRVRENAKQVGVRDPGFLILLIAHARFPCSCSLVSEETFKLYSFC